MSTVIVVTRTRAARHTLRIALAAMSLVVLSSAPAQANLIENPSFEVGPDPGEAMELAMGSTAITAWVVTRDAIDYCGTRWEAAEGSRSLALNGTGPGGIAQSIATNPGAEYTVRFRMSGDAFSSPILKHIRVAAAGQSQDYEFDAGHAWPWGMGWLEKTFVFTADSDAATIEFYSLDAGDTGPVIDQVEVTGPSVGIVPIGGALEFALAPPYPNPARTAFQVSFVLPSDTPLRLSVWDAQGREVSVIAEGIYPAGRHTRVWDGRAAHGPAPAGLYLIRLAASGVQLTRKAVLSR
ncbi:MAG TPA: choice-of-anchor C family protein [Candidatus Limnocylindria bacterium]|nr:choice-of-anchor C family protein [Candidatus Limnocylindria bacterium]